MLKGFLEFWSALNLYPVGPLLKWSYHDAGEDELALDGAQLVVLAVAGIVVDDGHVVVPDMPLLLVAVGVPLEVVRHQGGHMEDNLQGLKIRNRK